MRSRRSVSPGQEMPSTAFWLGVLIVAFVCLSLVFSWRTPVGQNGRFNTPDEGAHLQLVRHIAQTGTLPQFTGYSGAGYEAHQPPAYYLAAAVVWKAASPLNTPDARARAVRCLSTLFGILIICAVWYTARVLFPESQTLPLAAAAFTALLPMHLAICSAISNDALCNLAFALFVMDAAIALRSDGGSFWPAVRLGLWTGLAVWTKLTGLILIPMLLLVVIWAWGKGNGRPMALFAAGVAALALLIPWGLHAYRRSPSDPLQLKAFERTFSSTALRRDIEPAAGGPAAYARLTAEWTYRSFWFAYGNERTASTGRPLFLPDEFYRLCGFWHLSTLAGLVMTVFSQRQRWPKGVMTWWIIAFVLTLLVCAAFGRFLLMYFQTQGRYLFPALAPIAIAFAVGWRGLFPGRLKGAADILLMSVMQIFVLLALTAIW